MKHVGILAHSVEGAALCLRSLAHVGFEEIGPHDHPDVTLDCTAMARSMSSWDSANYSDIRAHLAVNVQRLAAAGCDFFICPDNTAHIALESDGAPLALPGLHIADVVAERARDEKRSRVGVMGTRYTMDSSLYPRAFAKHGIAFELPSASDRKFINDTIFDELVNGVFTDAARARFVSIIDRFAAVGCDAVALVCTEIPLLVSAEVSPLPALDSTRLLARAAVEVAIGRRSRPTWRGGPHIP